MLTLALTHQLASAAPAADACTPLEGRDLASVTRFRGCVESASAATVVTVD
jgi:hypothetical protein